ncbi:MAG: iron-sulfur cluster insertion protein ErpA [Alphaproteobacteria bacterium]
MSESISPADSTQLAISENAARRIAVLLAAEDKAALGMRISVSGGGCAGFQYAFSFDDALNADDRVFERDGARVVVDEVSLEFLKGAEVDFVEDLLGAYFKVQNPNATSSCGCGSSFSV